MVITSNMARTTVRTTFALDPETVEALDRLADRWDASKSDVVRRVVQAAARVEEIDATSDALAALGELQALLGLDPERAEAWIERVREERAAGFDRSSDADRA